jgi:small subunit ribosomal protein S13
MSEQKNTNPEVKTSTFKHIVRIANVDVPGNKPIRIALTKIKGVGINIADIVCTLCKVDRQSKTGNLDSESVTRLTELLNDINNKIPVWLLNRRKDYESGENKHLITGTLNFVKENDIRLLQKIKCYRGSRHQARLPSRGQRTRSNFRRSKGKVVGVKKKSK